MRDELRKREGERSFSVEFEVRFPEVDSYGVVWHGHYVLYMELARNALCAAAGLTPATALAAGYKVPITKVELELKRPARLDDRVRVTASLRPPRTAMIELDYEIFRMPGGELLGRGHSDQVILNPSGELLLTLPAAVKELLGRIRAYQRGEVEFPLPKILPA
jgi:acyl-CoA thioester hydrolase